MEFRKWLEMAMDFSTVSDPFEPEFKDAMKKRKALVYHGTSTKWFWPIVRNGFTFDQKRKNWDNVTPGVFVTFDPNRTDWYSHKAANVHGGEPIILVAEIPFSMLDRDPDDKDKFDASAKVQAFSPVPIPAKYLTGVIYPVSTFDLTGGRPPETPMKKFITKVNRGKVEGIPPEDEWETQTNEPSQAGVKRRFATATPDDREHAVVNMLQDLIQYTNLAHWVTDSSYEFSQKVLLGLSKMTWMTYYNWNGPKWLQWLEQLLGEKIEPHYYDNLEDEYSRPTYQLIRRFEDTTGYYQYRLGRQPPKRQ